ncbi:class II aldolase/adducin family protein [Marinospirillum perlucidum]|uniref:class II aldolase/adducin family protein n=1 Tax=Marinospirillum perlucidum TaxID=1982602 RepID=UPI000DF4C591|nr:class II aldolase/adducin family protein [Marinospirillum perlucidum]
MSSEQEGVIQYHYELLTPSQEPPAHLLEALNHWRRQMIKQGWLGQEPGRYQGLGFGNISHRWPAHGQPAAFLISASQTGKLGQLPAEAWPRVLQALTENNQVVAEGWQPPSSESLSHAVIYQAAEEVEAVIHIHSPALWQAAPALGCPCTDAALSYGTPALARAIAREITQPQGLVALLGHQDGLLSWGRNLEEAAESLYALQSRLVQQQ